MADCRTFTIPGVTSTVTLPVDRYWGGGYWGLYYWGSSYWGSPTVTIWGVPDERTFTVEAEDRTITVEAENRTFTVLEDNRTFIISSFFFDGLSSFYGTGIYGTNRYGEILVPDERTFTIPAESRTFTIECEEA